MFLRVVLQHQEEALDAPEPVDEVSVPKVEGRGIER
jgi:hypothetical protein